MPEISNPAAGIEPPRGSHAATVDEKGRLKLPAPFKRYVESFGEKRVFVTSLDLRTVGIYPTAVWREVERFFENPKHPYSRGLLDSMPQFSHEVRRLNAIPGSVPRLSEMPEGCKFHPRCAHVMPRCRREEPAIYSTGEEEWARCYLYQI